MGEYYYNMYTKQLFGTMVSAECIESFADTACDFSTNNWTHYWLNFESPKKVEEESHPTSPLPSLSPKRLLFFRLHILNPKSV